VPNLLTRYRPQPAGRVERLHHPSKRSEHGSPLEHLSTFLAISLKYGACSFDLGMVAGDTDDALDMLENVSGILRNQSKRKMC
jgi:hypothetical protein